MPDEGIDRFEALRMYTEIAATASFEEQVRGSITVGKAADLVVLNDDPTRVNADEIKKIKVEMTIIGGEIVWQQKNRRSGINTVQVLVNGACTVDYKKYVSGCLDQTYLSSPGVFRCPLRHLNGHETVIMHIGLFGGESRDNKHGSKNAVFSEDDLLQFPDRGPVCFSDRVLFLRLAACFSIFSGCMMLLIIMVPLALKFLGIINAGSESALKEPKHNASNDV